MTEWIEQSVGYVTNYKFGVEHLEDMKKLEKEGRVGPISGPYVQTSKFEAKLVK